MAPVTRSHTNAKRGKFVKDVLEHPPVMDSVIQHIINIHSSSENTMRDLGNLALVFKSTPTCEVIQKHIRCVHEENLKQVAMKKLIKTFTTKISSLLSIFHSNEGEYERIECLNNIYTYIIEHGIVVLHANHNLKKTVKQKLHEFNRLNINFRLKYGNELVETFERLNL
jgi:hypothetical protein